MLPLVSHGEYADGTDRQTDRQTDGRVRRNKHCSCFMLLQLLSHRKCIRSVKIRSSFFRWNFCFETQLVVALERKAVIRTFSYEYVK